MIGEFAKNLYRRYDRSLRHNSALRWVRRRPAEIARLLSPPDFWYGRYPHTFLERTPPEPDGPLEVPNIIWVFWTGDNPLTPNREAGLVRIRGFNPGTDVELVTPDRLDSFVVPGHPLHPAYEYLSLEHRSDYLRAYFLHHYGGGYADVKPLVASWRPAMDRLRDSDRWLLGVPLTDPAWASGDTPGRLGTHLMRYYRELLSASVLVAKSHSPFTGEWLREVDRRLDYYEPALREHTGPRTDQESRYPIVWTGILGQVFHPLCLKHRGKLLTDHTVTWDQSAAYR